MKVLHINGYDTGGGAESVFNITRINKNNEKNYSGFIETVNSKNSPDVKFSAYYDYPKIVQPIVYFFSVSNYSTLKKFLMYNKIDVVHLHNFIGVLSPSILLAIRRTKNINHFKVVQTAHDFNISCPNSMLYNYSKTTICEKCLGKKIKIFPLFQGCDRRGKLYSILKGIRSVISNNILSHRRIVDKFIAPSEFMKSKMIEDEIDKEKISVIRNPFPYASTNNYVKENIICYFGRFSKEKDVPFIIEAFTYWKQKRNNDFKLFLIGGGEEESNIIDMVKENPFNKEIIVNKFLPESKLKNYIKFCKYLVLASRSYENAPMTILEAVSLNIIPIVPKLGGMQETIDSVVRVGKTYNINNLESFAECLDDLEEKYEEEIKKIIALKGELNNNLGIAKYHAEISRLYNEISGKDNKLNDYGLSIP